ncbi:shikimate dehydrogenase [Methanolinea mesophila]|uniref:shikimate dehydrogenase n=1 Tax=Methanolinea mesophila TaxID=547055 RepID=UPI001AE317DE|nr:shikimate dehydrogenase [Methanolinea mesophila]MBP1927861.1 shikimate dehydrogenase [Methanolinea mesophila]
MRAVLIGFRGTGKTEVGRLLAHINDVPFFDTDRMIEESAEKTIYEIFAEQGEEEFRRKERRVIASLPEGDAVIATGGGAILDPGNVRKLREGSTVFLLQADEAAIERRIRDTRRPSLTRLPLRDEIHELLAVRRDAYLSAADFCIDTTIKNANEVSLEIHRVLSGGAVSWKRRERGMEVIRASGIGHEDIGEIEKVLMGEGTDTLTRVYAIMGYPCTHSKSPQLFNRLFSRYRVNAFYTRLQDPEIGTVVRVAGDIDLRGASVTIPFKQAIIPSLDHLDRDADAIGAVNTVVYCGGKSYGSNTDWLGIRGPLAEYRKARAVVLGAGGAAAAAVYALQDLEMEVTVLNRTPGRAEELSARFGCAHAPLSAFEALDPGVVVNATPVGMTPDHHSPLRPGQLKSGMVIFDLVYTPPETPLIRMARNAGARVIQGPEMFVRQAAAQFRRFTGIQVPPAEIKEMME